MATLAGLAAALGVAIAVAGLVHTSSFFERSFYPLVVASQSLPTLALAPLLVVWFGYGFIPKIFVVALLCFFPMAVNTIEGLKSVDVGQIDMLRSLGAKRSQIFWHVYGPSALVALLSGLKVAASYAAVGAMVGEWVGSSRGLGYFMLRSSSQFLTDRVFAAIVILALIGVGLYQLVDLSEKWLAPWHARRKLEEKKRRKTVG